MAFTNKTPSIQEGGTAKNLSCAKLRTAKQSGGTMLWVPEEEVSLGTKSVNKNGTYTAASAGKYGFSQFSVNVPGGNGSADSHGKPTGGDIKPGGAGSAVVGTDPETGNDVVVGVDEDENLVKTPLPSSIVLVTPPTKTDYNDGENIDLSGAVVVAKMADGTTWTDVDHPNGHVSCTPDPAAADASAVESRAVEYNGNRFVYTADYGYIESENGNFDRLTKYTGGTVYFFTSTTPSGRTELTVTSNADFSLQDTYKYYTQSGQKIVQCRRTYWSGRVIYFEGANSDACVSVHPPSSVEFDSTGYGIAWEFWEAMEKGTIVGGTQPITLSWARPGDGKVLSTTMEINVGAHTTESSSGTEGSGGGGSF